MFRPRTRRGWGVSVTPAAFYPQERPGTHCTEGWVGPRAGWTAENIASIGIRSPDRPVHSQSLYRLSYPANATKSNVTTNSTSYPPSAFMCFVCRWTQHSLRTDDTRTPKIVYVCVKQNQVDNGKDTHEGGTSMMAYTTGGQTCGLGHLLYKQKIFRDLPQYKYASLNDGHTFWEMRL